VLPPPGLGGTSWQLVAFRRGDGTLLQPDDRSRYTIAFEPDGIFTARIDCNRARGGWKSSGPGRIEFGAAMAATRAQCPPGSLHDVVMRQLPYVRTYVIRDGRLYLNLMADGGALEFISSP